MNAFINVTYPPYCAKGDGGGTNNVDAFKKAIDDIPDAKWPWAKTPSEQSSDEHSLPHSANAGVIYVPSAEKPYYLAKEVRIPQSKNITIMSDGRSGARISTRKEGQASGGPYAFYRHVKGAGTFGGFALRDIIMDGCGVRIAANSRNFHEFRRVMFINTERYAISLQDAGDCIGGVVGGRIEDCMFDSCYGGVICRGPQSNLWLVTRCFFVRGREQPDIVLEAPDWTVEGCNFEQRLGHERPWISIRAGGVSILSNRFGNEAPTSDRQPPRECIAIEPVDRAGDDESDCEPPKAEVTTGMIRIVGNNFRGRALSKQDDWPDNSANAAIRLRRPTRDLIIRDNSFWPYKTSIIDLDYTSGANGSGSGNVLDVSGGIVAPRGFAGKPLFSPREPDQGPLGGWTVVGREERDVALGQRVRAEQLLADTGAIDSSDSWDKDNVTVSKNATGPDGSEKSAYTISGLGGKTSTVSHEVRLADDEPLPEGEPVTFSAWFRKPTDSKVDVAALRIQLGDRWLNRLANTARLSTQWQPLWVTIFPEMTISPEDRIRVFIQTSEVGEDAESGDIEVAWPMLNRGYVPLDYTEKPNSG